MGAPPAAVKVSRSTVRPALKPARPVLVLVSGLPGTGKSFFSRQLADKLPCTILESDAIRKKLFPHPTYAATESVGVFRFIQQKTEELLGSDKSVIVDATNLTERHRQSFYRAAEKTSAGLIIVQVDAPPEIVKDRLKSRIEHPVANERSDADWAIYQKMKSTVEKIKLPHFVVDSTRDITPVITRIVKEAQR